MNQNPFIPLEKADTVIVAGNCDEEVLASLRKLRLEIIPTCRCPDVDQSIAYHPDIVIHPVNHNTLVIAPNVFDYYKEVLSGKNIKLIKGERELKVKYPYDIAYNVGRVENFALHRLDSTDEVLKFYLEKEGLEFINVRQGYTKCSMAIIDEGSVITSDIPIYNILREKGIDVLLISPGYIDLEYQDYGFIGGATGNFSKDTVLVSGLFHNHPDGERILNFIKSKNLDIYFLSSKNIVDLGTLITLNCH
mgnify:CR=1 FL=1